MVRRDRGRGSGRGRASYGRLLASREGNRTLSRLVSFTSSPPSDQVPSLPRASSAASSSAVGGVQDRPLAGFVFGLTAPD